MKSFNHLIGHLVSCKDVSHLVSEMQDRELTTVERWKLKWHLAVCTMCMTFEKQMRLMREAMRRYRQ
jgi:putative zinc finger protein